MSIRASTDARWRLRHDPDGMALDTDSLHELWRLELLDELRRRRAALEYEPQLDRYGRRRAALTVLIESVERKEIEALHKLPDGERRHRATRDPRSPRVEERLH
jgi:hypothetical protein